MKSRTRSRARRTAPERAPSTKVRAAAKRIRYAIVGLGNIAQGAVLPAFVHAKNSELVAILSGEDEKLAEVGAMFDVPVRGHYDDLEAIIRTNQIDAVYIALPNVMHKETTLRAMKAGAHVLCEKPMAVDERECRAMIEAAKKYDKKLMIAYRLHFEEGNLAAIDVAKSGEIGEPRIFSSEFTQEVRRGDIRTQKAMAGGALYDMGVYCINAARYIFRAEPEEVTAFLSKGHDKRFKNVEEMATAILRFPGGRLAQLTASQGAASVSEYRVIGTKGDLHVAPAFGYHAAHEHTVTVDKKSRKKSFPVRDQFAAELIYFSRCILNDTEPEPSGEEGLADVRIIRAILKSARTGRAVKLAPFARDKRPTMRMEIKKPPPKKPRLVHAPGPAVR